MMPDDEIAITTAELVRRNLRILAAGDIAQEIWGESESLRSTAIHESAHAVIAMIQGHFPWRVVVMQDGAGYVQFDAGAFVGRDQIPRDDESIRIIQDLQNPDDPPADMDALRAEVTRSLRQHWTLVEQIAGGLVSRSIGGDAILNRGNLKRYWQFYLKGQNACFLETPNCKS